MRLHEVTSFETPQDNNNYTTNITSETQNNTKFRRVLHTTKLSQLVVMSLKPNEDIGMETHPKGDQFIRVESGKGKIILDDKEENFNSGDVVMIAAGTEHNIINMSNNENLQIYVIYTPPEHKNESK